MEDEFTTRMHAELLEGEETHFDVMIMGIVGATRGHKSLRKALEEYPEITYDEFKKNVARVMCYNSWDDFVKRHSSYIDI